GSVTRRWRLRSRPAGAAWRWPDEPARDGAPAAGEPGGGAHALLLDVHAGEHGRGDAPRRVVLQSHPARQGPLRSGRYGARPPPRPRSGGGEGRELTGSGGGAGWGIALGGAPPSFPAARAGSDTTHNEPRTNGWRTPNCWRSREGGRRGCARCASACWARAG